MFATAFSLNEDDHSPWRKKIVESIERFLDMTGLFYRWVLMLMRLRARPHKTQFYRGGELAVAQRIQEERIDVLINLAGHTRANDMVTKICACVSSRLCLLCVILVFCRRCPLSVFL